MVGVEVVKDTRRRLRRSIVGGSRGTIDAARVDDDDDDDVGKFKCDSGSQQ